MCLIETGCGLRDTDTVVNPRVTYPKWSFSYQINYVTFAPRNFKYSLLPLMFSGRNFVCTSHFHLRYLCPMTLRSHNFITSTVFSEGQNLLNFLVLGNYFIFFGGGGHFLFSLELFSLAPSSQTPVFPYNFRN